MADSSEIPPSLRDAFESCTELSPMCPIEFTVLGYAPNMGASIFFSIGFALAMVGTIGIGVWKKTWSFMGFIAAGCALEMSGYIGRIILSDNPWNSDAFQLQICAIILGPTIICAGIYLIIKHVALNLDPSLSRFDPKWYPLFFLPADVSCLLVQAIGGALAAAAGHDNKPMLDGGNRSIIAGVCLQVVVLSLFGLVSGEYLLRVRKKVKGLGREAAVEGGLGLWFEKRFRVFLGAVMVAYALVLTRCIYRIAEMAGGWGNPIMQDEISFAILDSTFCLVAVSTLTVFAPGLYFPHMAVTRKSQPSDPENSDAEKTATATPAEPAEVALPESGPKE